MPTSVRWANLALTTAKKRLGAGWAVLSPEMRHAFVCAELVAIFSSQEVANGDHMKAASEAVIDMLGRECT